MRWIGALVVALAVVAVVGFAARGGFGGAGGLLRRSSGDGPPVPGARGRLAYVRDGDVWVYSLTAGAERRVTTSGGASRPRWSGGGVWLSFVREGGLWVVRQDGSGLMQVPDGDVPASATWAQRGASLAYSTAAGALKVFEPAQPARNRPAPQAERGARVIVPAGSGVGPHLAWSFDGVRIGYERHQRAGESASNEGIWTVAANGRDPLPVFVASGDYSLTFCCWTADDRYVLFWQGPLSASIAADGLPLYIALASSSQPGAVAPAVLLERGWVDSAPRSSAVAVIAGGGREATAGKRLLGAVPVPRSPSNAVQTIPLVDQPDRAPAWPAWAPSSSVLAFTEGPSLVQAGGDLAASLANRRIWLIQPDGTQKRPLLPDATVPAGVSDERPVWARDGKTLVFARRLQPEAASRASLESPDQTLPGGVELWAAAGDGSSARRAVSGLADPGAGNHGLVDWGTLFDYYRG